MKIALLSPNPVHLEQMRQVLDGPHQVLAAEGGKSRMKLIAQDEQPDLMVVDGMCCDTQELSQVEYVTTHHPGTAVILLCAAVAT